jgi:hypothetical protein
MLRADIGYEASEPLRIDAPVTLQDIAPTLYDYAEIPAEARPPVDGRSVRGLLDPSVDGWGHERPIAIAHLRYGLDRWGVVFDHHKYILHTASGEEELYDLRTDPSEHENLAGALTVDQLAPFRTALSASHTTDISSVPVGRGWRIRGTVHRADEPLVFTFTRPAEHGGLVDPELTIKNPKNQAWGEPPRRAMSEVGDADLSEDGLTLTWTPGTNPRDVLLYVVFPEGDDLAVSGTTVTRGDDTLSFLKDPLGSWTWSSGINRLTIESGTILVPPPGEAARMRALSQETGAEDDIDMLKAMGYIHDD